MVAASMVSIWLLLLLLESSPAYQPITMTTDFLAWCRLMTQAYTDAGLRLEHRGKIHLRMGLRLITSNLRSLRRPAYLLNTQRLIPIYGEGYKNTHAIYRDNKVL